MTLAGEATRTVFLSYAREDGDLVLPVAHLLRAAGATVFVDAEGIPYGEEWEPALLGQLRAAERILVFWSLHSAGSAWVRREHTTAIEAGLRVVPVPLDDTPLPAELAKLQALVELVPLLHRAQRGGSNDVPARAPWRRYRRILSAAVLLFAVLLFLTLGLSRPQYAFEPPVPDSAVLLFIGLLLGLGLMFWYRRRVSRAAVRRVPAELERAVLQAVFADWDRAFQN